MKYQHPIQNSTFRRTFFTLILLMMQLLLLAQITVVCPPDITLNLNAPPFTLTGADPPGGMYSGPGVIENTFFPQFAGPGPHLIQYMVVVGTSSGFCNFIIHVQPLTFYEGLHLSVGDYLKPWPAHYYLSAEENAVPVRLTGLPHDVVINGVQFSASSDGVNWIPFYSDGNGVDFKAPGPQPALTGFDGWKGYFQPLQLPPSTAPWNFRADIFFPDGSSQQVQTEYPVMIDYSPPSSVSVSFSGLNFDPSTGFWDTETGTIEIDINPLSANLLQSGIGIESKPEYFSKGVPGTQQPGAMDCGPTAVAACLSWFAMQGDPGIMGGMSIADLIDSLKTICRTDDAEGTWDDDLAAGIRWWLGAHGLGYSVRHISTYGPDGAGGVSRQWTPENMEQMRSELENGQDVIPLFNWVNADGTNGGHFMTMNSFLNNKLPNGNYQVDFMDPATGEIIVGEIDPATGTISGYENSSGDTYPPDGAEITSYIVICPIQPGQMPGTNIVLSGPDPAPYSVSLPSQGLYWLKLAFLDVEGHEDYRYYPVSYTSGTVITPSEMKVVVGEYFLPYEPNNYLGSHGDIIPVKLTGTTPSGTIYPIVNFEYSPDSVNWILFDTDTDGTEAAAPGPISGANSNSDGWTGYLDFSLIPLWWPEVFFRARVLQPDNTFLDVPQKSNVRFLPQRPDKVDITINGSLLADMPFADSYFDVFEGPQSVTIDQPSVFDEMIRMLITTKQDTFQKSVPLIPQWGVNDCGPVALASCLGWFAANGDPAILGGLGEDDLIDSLKVLCETIDTVGTYDHKLAAGAAKWLSDKGYSARFFHPAKKDASGAVIGDWKESDWAFMRSELEKGQNVIPLFTWTDPDGSRKGHYMTMNAIINTPLPNGNYKVGFMDPSTGEYVWGELNAVTGISGGFQNSNGDFYPPQNAQITSYLVICPQQSTPPPAIATFQSPVPDLQPFTFTLPEAGLFWMSVEVTDANGNSGFQTIPIRVLGPCQPDTFKVAWESEPFPLRSGPPTGGFYIGTGVMNNHFNPQLAGPGIHFIHHIDPPSAPPSCKDLFIEVQKTGLSIRAGDYLNPLPQHNWVSPDPVKPLEVELLGSNAQNILTSLEVGDFFAPGSEPFDGWPYYIHWPGSIDTGGTSYGATGPIDLSEGIDGWNCQLPLGSYTTLTLSQPLMVFAKVTRDGQDWYMAETIKIDPSPPSSVLLNIADWFTTTSPSVYLDVEPVLANISELYCAIVTKPDSFAKGVPAIAQPGANDCGPTALTACFRWFAAQGDTGICGSLADTAIIRMLRDSSGTPGDVPIYGDDLAKAAEKWLAKKGKGYEVRHKQYESDKPDGTIDRKFNEDSWKEMRNELEKGQDVITLFNWKEDGVDMGHFMTFNSIVNKIQANGKYRVDYMDPSSGEIIYGDMDPVTGAVSGFTDSEGNLYPPDGAVVTENIIICPKPEAIVTSNKSSFASFTVPGPDPDSILINLPDTGLYWVHLIIRDLDGHEYEIDRIIERVPATASVSGIVSYDNNAGTPLSGVVLHLLKDGLTVETTTTASDGSYSFEGLDAGLFTIELQHNGIWGGVNSVDALGVMKHFVGITTLQGLRLQAADVNQTSYINTTDALDVMKRFVGYLNGFPTDDWIFEETTFNLLQGEQLILNIKGICAGDVDGSYSP